MKKLKVTIQVDMSVPEDWVLVTTSEGGQVVKMQDGQYLDLAVEPLFATDPEDTWSSTDDVDELNDLLDMVESEEVTFTMVSH